MRSLLLVGSLAWALAAVACGGGKTETEGSETGGDSSTGDASAGSSGSTSGSTSAPTSGVTEAEGSSGTDGGVVVPAKHSEGCAPDDGLAVEFSVGISERLCSADFGADAPTLRISLFQGVTLPPGVYPLDGGNGSVFFEDGEGEVFGDMGTLTIVEVVADGYVGSYDVTLSDSTKLSGAFSAVYCPQDVLCG